MFELVLMGPVFMMDLRYIKFPEPVGSDPLSTKPGVSLELCQVCILLPEQKHEKTYLGVLGFFSMSKF